MDGSSGTVGVAVKTRKSRPAKAVIHVDRHHIAANAKGADKPVFSVKRRGKTTKGNVVRIFGPSTFVYRPERPLSCGARAWVETMAEVEVE